MYLESTAVYAKRKAANLAEIESRIRALDPKSPRFGCELRMIRLALSLKESELAFIALVNRRTLHGWENQGKPPYKSQFVHLKEVLLRVVAMKPCGCVDLVKLIPPTGHVAIMLTAACSGQSAADEIFGMFASVADNVVAVRFEEGALTLIGSRKDRPDKFLEFAIEISRLCLITSIQIQ